MSRADPTERNLFLYRAFLILAACLVIAALGSTKLALSQHRTGALSFVPNGAVAVASFNWTIVSRDDHFRRMFNAEQLDRALAELSIEGGDISEIAMFTGVDTSSSGTIAGIFRGSFSPQVVVSQLKSKNLSETTYRGRTTYFNQSEQSYTSVLKSGMLVVGSEKGVRSVIDTEINPRSGVLLRPPFSTMLSTFKTSQHPISFMMGIPNEYRSIADITTQVVSAVFKFSGLGPIGFVLDKIGFPYTLGFSIARTGSTFPVVLLAQMKDASAASLISGTLNLMQGISVGMLADRLPSADREILKNVSVGTRGDLVSIKMVLREQDLPR